MKTFVLLSQPCVGQRWSVAFDHVWLLCVLNRNLLTHQAFTVKIGHTIGVRIYKDSVCAVLYSMDQILFNTVQCLSFTLL